MRTRKLPTLLGNSLTALLLPMIFFACGPVNSTSAIYYKAELLLEKAKWEGVDKDDFQAFFEDWCKKPQPNIHPETQQNICNVRLTCPMQQYRDNYYCKKAADIYLDKSCEVTDTGRIYCYHYFKARGYLVKAKEVEGYAQFEQAAEYAQKASKKAQDALDSTNDEKSKQTVDESKGTKSKKYKSSSEDDILKGDGK